MDNFKEFNIANSVHCSVISHCIKYQLNALYYIYYYFVSHYADMFRRFNRHLQRGTPKFLLMLAGSMGRIHLLHVSSVGSHYALNC
jgi:hypothetical protein